MSLPVLIQGDTSWPGHPASPCPVRHHLSSPHCTTLPWPPLSLLPGHCQPLILGMWLLGASDPLDFAGSGPSRLLEADSGSLSSGGHRLAGTGVTPKGGSGGTLLSLGAGWSLAQHSMERGTAQHGTAQGHCGTAGTSVWHGKAHCSWHGALVPPQLRAGSSRVDDTSRDLALNPPAELPRLERGCRSQPRAQHGEGWKEPCQPQCHPGVCQPHC